MFSTDATNVQVWEKKGEERKSPVVKSVYG